MAKPAILMKAVPVVGQTYTIVDLLSDDSFVQRVCTDVGRVKNGHMGQYLDCRLEDPANGESEIRRIEIIK